ncbi:hypothetical protein MKX01_008634 [Papaver californicum]|nr:hypothetical protein MKX01_008634 [Papaver californicum]
MSVNYNVMPWRICVICRVLDHKLEPCVEGEVMIVDDPATSTCIEGNMEVEVRSEVIIIEIVGHNGHQDMSKDKINKARLIEMELEAAYESIEPGNTSISKGKGKQREDNTILSSQVEVENDLDKVANQISREVEDRRIMDERNKIKRKTKVCGSSSDLGSSRQVLVLPPLGPLIIEEGTRAVSIEEAVKRLNEANEFRLKVGTLLDFTINIKEPERKKRKYKKKVVFVDDEQIKKSRIN